MNENSTNIIYKIFMSFLILVISGYMIFSSTVVHIFGNFDLVAYAEEKEDSKDSTTEEKVEQKKNVYDALADNPDKLKTVLKSVSYSKQMQYLMTYTILGDSYLSTSGYSGMYRNTNGWKQGAENNLDININTGYASVLDEEGASNSHEEKTDKAEEKSTKETKEDKTSKQIKEVLLQQVLSLYGQRFGMSYATNSEPMTNRNIKSSGKEIVFGEMIPSDIGCILNSCTPTWKNYYDISNYVFSLQEKYKDKIGGNSFRHGYLLRPTDNFKSASSASGIVSTFNSKNNDVYSKVYDYLEKEVNSAVDSGNLNDFLGDKQFFNTSTIQIINERINEGISSASYLQTLEKLQDGKSGNYTYSMPIRGSESDANKIYKKYVNSLQIMPSLQKKSSDFKSINNKWVDETKKKIAKIPNAEKVLEENAKSKGDSSASDKAKNTKTLGWIPLRINVKSIYNGLDSGDKKKYETFTSEYDGGKANSDGDVTQGSGKTRYLRINDILNLEASTVKTLKNSASPYLTSHYDTFKNSKGDAKIGKTTSLLGGDNLASYAGMSVKKTDAELLSSLKSLVSKGQLKDADKGIATRLTLSEIESMDNNKAVARLIALRTKDAKQTESNNDDDYIMGVDNYGNLISGETLQVVVPYWQNVTISEYKNINKGNSQFIASPVLDELGSNALKSASNMYSKITPIEKGVDLGTMLGLKNAEKVELENYLKKTNTNSEGLKTLGNNLKNDWKARQAYALAITQYTSDDVKSFNTRFLKKADEGKELYLVPSSGDETKDAKDSDEEKLGEFTAKDLLEKLRMFFEGGAYELIRLTIASFVISFYTSNVANFTMGAIFYTTTITESTMWSDLVPTIVTLLVSFTGVYLLVMTVKVLRRTMTIKKMFQQFIMLTLVLLIPTLVYTPLINFALNKPTEKVLGNQLEQMSIVDTMLSNETDLRKYDEKYQLFFGSVDELREKKDDYIVKFYTTTHVDGFDINTVTYDQLPEKNKFRNTELLQTGKWRKSDLVSIDVSIYDLFKWASDENETRSLFEYLQSTDETRYADVAKYTEFSADTSFKNDILGVNIAGKKWKASELYKLMYQNTTDEKISNSINSVFDITSVFRNRSNDSDKDKITNDDKENLIRDLSMTAKSRQIAFGDAKKLSPQSMQLYQQYSNVDYIPDSDIFGLQDTVNMLVPYRNPKDTSLESDTYEINKKILNEYISNYSIVREVLGKDDSKVKLAEFKIITLNMWFSVNKIIDMPMFPTEYRPETVSFDSYMRMAFIPINAYKNLEDKGLDNVGKYVGLRYHPVALLLFLGAILSLIAFGFIYVVVFYVVMMALMVIMFIYNYIIKNNFDSKAWLGSLFIIGTFAIAKLGLLLLWYGMSYYMNYSFAMNNGESYPYVSFHSLMIIVYVAFLIFFVFKRLFKNVVEDFSNLGASGFIRDTKNITNKFMNSVFGMRNKLLSTANSSGKSFGKGIEKVLGNEGQLGTPSKRDLAMVGSAFSLGNLRRILDNKSSGTKKYIQSIKNKLDSKSSDSSDSDFVENLTAKSLKGIKGKSVKKLAEEYQGIKGRVLGLSDKDKNILEQSGGLGKVLHSTEDGVMLSELALGNKDVANKMVSSLAGKGIKAFATKDGNLMFDSTKINLENPNDRKAVFGDSINQLLSETKNVTWSKITDYENDESSLNYTRKDNGYLLRVGEDGLSPKLLDNILDSDVFKENFALLEEPMTDSNGEYMHGYLNIVPKNADADVDSIMAQIGNVDATQRNYNGEKPRESFNVNKSIDFAHEGDVDIANKYFQNGMRLQGNRLLYNEFDISHQKAIKNMQKEMNKVSDMEYKEKSDILTRLTAQVARGENNGYDIFTSNTNENKDAYIQAVNAGIINPNSTESTVYVGNKADALLSNLKDVSKIANNKSSVITDFQQAKHQLLSEGEMILSGGENAGIKGSESYVELLANNAESLGVADDKVMEAKSQFESLKKQKATGQMSDKTYERQLEIVKSNLQSRLDDTGNLSKVQANALTQKVSELAEQNKENKSKSQKAQNKKQRDKINSILSSYATANEGLKEQGINNTSAEKLIGSQTLYDLQDFAKNLDDVQKNPDGTLFIRTTGNNFDAKSLENAIKTLMPNK